MKQICPVCNGKKLITVKVNTESVGVFTSREKVCPHCHGMGALPDPKSTAIRVSLKEQIRKYADRTGNYPHAILAETDAFMILICDPDTYTCRNNVYRWCGIPLKMVSGGGMGIYLCGAPIPISEPKRYGPRLVLPEE